MIEAQLSHLPERLSSKIAVDPAGCWLWTASLRGGYGQFRLGPSTRAAHVVVYELLVGVVPAGRELDHLCRVRRCVNPAHLEPVTHRENLMRGVGPTALNAIKTHCAAGHELTEDNVYRNKRDNGRQCKTCTIAAARATSVRARARRYSGRVWT